MSVRIASLSLVLAVTVCTPVLAARTTAHTVKLVIDDWWGRDFADSNCNVPAYAPPTAQGRAECKQDSIGEYDDFRQRLLTYFAADPGCADVVVVPMNVRAQWSLMLDYIPTRFAGSSERSWWSVSQFGAFNNYEGDRDTPREIARHVCAIIRRRGAVVRAE